MRPILLALLACTALTHADDRKRSREYVVKAALLRAFAGYTTWPKGTFEKPGSPVVIGVVGRDPFGRVLDALGKKSVGGRPIDVRRVKKARNLAQCHVLFFGVQGDRQRAAALKVIDGEAVLAVGENPGFATREGHIGLFLARGRVRFEVNRAAVERADLKLHAKLLGSAARIVKDEHPSRKPEEEDDDDDDDDKKPKGKKDKGKQGAGNGKGGEGDGD